MAQHVGQALLHDPVAGVADRRRYRLSGRRHVQLDGQACSLDPGDQVAQVREPGPGRPQRHAVAVVVAQALQRGAQLAQRLAGAAAAWAAVARLSSRPKWLLTRLAALVTALFLIPDFLLLGTPGNPAGPVAILMLMHLAIAVITYAALTELAPVRGALSARASRVRHGGDHDGPDGHVHHEKPGGG
jgi:hypothetical protein